MNVWTTKEGKEILIRDMETSHIKNTMKMLEKKNFMLTTKIYCGDGFDHGSNEVDELTWNYQDEYERMHLELRIRAMEGKK
jgi:hypothetical protein